MSNLPAGEVFISPETADGTFVVDGTMMPHGLLEDGRTLSFAVEDGFVTRISDDDIRETVEDAAETAGDAAYNLAELGIGTNVAVSDLVGSVLLDERPAAAPSTSRSATTRGSAATPKRRSTSTASSGNRASSPTALPSIFRSPMVTD